MYQDSSWASLLIFFTVADWRSDIDIDDGFQMMLLCGWCPQQGIAILTTWCDSAAKICKKNIQRYVHITKNPLFSVLSGDLPMSSKFPKRIVNSFNFFHDQKQNKKRRTLWPTVKLVGFHLNLEWNLSWTFLTIGAKRRVATGTYYWLVSHMMKPKTSRLVIFLRVD